LTLAREYAQTIGPAVAAGPGGLTALSVIVHGSVAFGDYVGGRSDVDILVVGELPDGGAQAAGEALAAVPVPRGCCGLECSVVSPSDIADLTPRRPFRLHVTSGEGGRRMVPGAGHPGDADLTLHYAVASARGFAVWGASVDELIPEQPRALVLGALRSELRWAADEASPFYAVLNGARALAYAREGVPLSKMEGWLWARRNGGPVGLLDRALTSYLTPSAQAPPWPSSAVAEMRSFLDEVSAELAAHD
jgi:aminoglycoside adenylyltransferase-like protein